MEWLGKHFIKVDRFFPSSKKCSRCGWINNDLTLKERTWTCLECGATHDRDVNASLNLRKEGMKILKEEKLITIISNNGNPTVGTTGSHAFGDNVRPKEILANIFRQLSMNEETISERKESPSFTVDRIFF